MNDKLTAIKATVAAVFSAFASFLGWKGIVAAAWVLLMAMDYFSGTAAACKEGNWSSRIAREGLWHKAGMILVVIAAGVADGVLSMLFTHLPGAGLSWPGMVLPMVLAWYILTELGSILENAVRLGAKVPGWLSKMLQISLEAVDGVADQERDVTE